jgi:hypothetical protein
MLFELSRQVRINTQLCQKLFGKHPLELFTEFDILQEKIKYNIRVEGYIETFGLKALSKLRVIENSIVAYIQRKRILDEEPELPTKKKANERYSI